MNRRGFIGRAGIGVAAAGAAPWAFAAEPAHIPMLQEVAQLPLGPGDEVTAMTVFHDIIVILTRYGYVFQLDLNQ